MASSTNVATNNTYLVSPPASTLVNFGLSFVTGFAYDPAANTIYIAAKDSSGFGNAVYGAAGGPIDVVDTMMDLAFSNGMVWAAGSENGGDVGYIDGIDPATSNVVQFTDFTPEDYSTLNPLAPIGITLAFRPSGIAWDGTNFWVSNNNSSTDALANGIYGTSIQQFVPTIVAGSITALAQGSSFTLWPDTWTAGLVSTPGRTPGGLAWDSGRLLVGTDSGEIWSVNPYAANPALTLAQVAIVDAGFVQGLEAVPEPSAFILLGTSLAGLAAFWRKRRSV